ncbi:hypothetical protein, partial [Propionibacterium freudenreichii]|uniref:hypothetical protein n=1 Tax=Propionibacterium freudenreichii TaxID=1744 RepID=UPI0021A4E08B
HGRAHRASRRGRCAPAGQRLAVLLPAGLSSWPGGSISVDMKRIGSSESGPATSRGEGSSRGLTPRKGAKL